MWPLIALLVLIAVWVHRRINKMSILVNNGIPGNEPHLIFGNMFEMKSLSMVERQNRLIEKYGKVVGYYTGAKPNILVADPELAKRIQIKDFHNFKNRSIFFRYLQPSPKSVGGLIQSRDQRWKQIRSLLSTAFSASKLKAMTPIMETSVNSFLDKINKKSKSGEEFNIYELYQRLTVEMIMKTSFGVEIDAQNNNNSRLLRDSHIYLESKVNKWILMIFMCFPEVANLISYLRGISELICQWLGVTPVGFLWKTSTQIIKLRKENPDQRRNDLLQSMIDSELTEKDVSNKDMTERLTENEEENKENLKNCEQNDITTKISKKAIHLTEDEIKTNCLTFLVVSYDTSSTGLAYVTHMLTNYPEIQENVRQEVIELFKSEGKLDYNTVTKLEYMEWVINETMRLYPPLVNGSTRECIADYKYKNLTIPKGATVAMCTHFLHHDPDYWSEPETFDPMRFSPERKQDIKVGSWQPFGGGPRICIAFRLAYLKMKLTLAKLLLEYRLETGPHSEIGGLATKYKLLSVVPKNGVFVRAVKI